MFTRATTPDEVLEVLQMRDGLAQNSDAEQHMLQQLQFLTVSPTEFPNAFANILQAQSPSHHQSDRDLPHCPARP